MLDNLKSKGISAYHVVRNHFVIKDRRELQERIVISQAGREESQSFDERLQVNGAHLTGGNSFAAEVIADPGHRWRKTRNHPRRDHNYQCAIALPLAAKNMQLMTESEVLQFKNGPTAESAGNNGDNGTQVLKHTGDTTTVLPKTLDFSRLSEFLVATGAPKLSIAVSALVLIEQKAQLTWRPPAKIVVAGRQI